MNPDVSQLDWFKSSYSGGSGSECVETARDRGMHVRDSKNPDGPSFKFSADSWAAFLTSVKAGEFGEP